MFFKTEVSGHWAKTPRNLEVVTRGGHLTWCPLSPGWGGESRRPAFFIHCIHCLRFSKQFSLPPSRGENPLQTQLPLSGSQHWGMKAQETTPTFHSWLLCSWNKTLHWSNKFCPKLQNVTISVTCPKPPPDNTVAQNIILYIYDNTDYIWSIYYVYNIFFIYVLYMVKYISRARTNILQVLCFCATAEQPTSPGKPCWCPALGKAHTLLTMWSFYGDPSLTEQRTVRGWR